MKGSVKIISWMCRIIVAVILLQTLFFKFTAAEESVYIFSSLLGAEYEAVGRIGSADGFNRRTSGNYDNAQCNRCSFDQTRNRC